MNFIIKLKSLHKREDTRPYILFIKTRRPWRTTLHLHSTSLESFTKEREATSWWFRRSPPCIYRCGTAPCGRQSRWSSLERTLRRAVEATRGRLSRLVTKLVRPNHLVWPNWFRPQPVSSSVVSLSGGPLCLWLMIALRLTPFASVLGHQIHMVVAWRHMIGWDFSPWIRRCAFSSIFSWIPAFINFSKDTWNVGILLVECV
jgi:hypothetical protein